MLRMTIATCLLMLLLQAAIDAGKVAKNGEQKTPTSKDAGKPAKNGGQTTPANKGVPAKVRAINLGRASVDLKKSNRPLPPPSNGWVVIMQRFDFSLNFTRNWTEYRNGFGELGLQKEFWIGNEFIHDMTFGVPHKLRIEILAGGTLSYADYESFSIDSEDKKYQLHVSGYSGNAGDSLTNKTKSDYWHLDGANFSAPVAQTDNSTTSVCAVGYKVGWWFKGCWNACLTCKLESGSALWGTLPSSINLTSTRMRIMRK